MVGEVPVGIEAALGGAGIDLGKGAIIGAMLLGTAFLAGFAALRRSAPAFCGFFLLVSGGALLTVWLGLAPTPGASVMFLLQGAFGAAALIFLSATIRFVARNQLLGGLLFAGALSIIGIGFINAFLGGEAAGLQRLALTGVAVTGIGLAAFASARGDAAARLILPGAALVAASPLLFGIAASGPLALAPQAVFAIGVLMAGMVALADFNIAPSSFSGVLSHGGQGVSTAFGAHERAPAERSATALRVSENQLAEVLDYAGVAVWDWNLYGSHQTASFATLMGADSDGAFTPEAFRAFIDRVDLARFDQKVYGVEQGDGGFDEELRLIDGRQVRLRGARAIDVDGALERIVVFVEELSASRAAPAQQKEDALKLAAVSLTGIAAAATRPAPPIKSDASQALAPAQKKEAAPSPRNDIVSAIENNGIVAAFQPIISFESGAVCGAEALARWPAAGASSEKATGEIVRKAQDAGKGRELAVIMLRAAAKHAADRIASGDKKFFAALNVSLSQVCEEGFVDDVRLAIGDHKLPPGALVLELTEGEKLTETPKIHDVFKKLKSAGASLAYDDFGAGFSSLSNLHKYDFDYLKIDKSFIDDIVANGGKKKIVTALARLGRDFGMTVIAEGVESKEAAELAKAIGCKMGQGFYLGEPVLNDASIALGGDVAARTPDLASIEVVRPVEPGKSATASIENSGELILDQSLEAGRNSGRALRRRLFSR